MTLAQGVVELAREMIDIESISGNEKEIAFFLRDLLTPLGWRVQLQEVKPERFNVIARRQKDQPRLIFNSHIDTVPPFFPSRMDGPLLRGRGACDTKSLIAAQLHAAQAMADDGNEDVGLLYVVGEEVDHCGMIAANKLGLDPDYIIVGEPTESKLVSRQKGVLKVRLSCQGKAAHSGYPHLGISAIDPLIDTLADLRKETWPGDQTLGETTMNIGIIRGGFAANVVPEKAFAEVMFRVVTHQHQLLNRVTQIVANRAKVEVVAANDPTDLATLPGYETSVIAFNTDIPYFEFNGKALLWGAGSILDAHTSNEKIHIDDLKQAIPTYRGLAETCLGLV